MKCPGQDMKYWKEDAIFETACPKCSATVEFYKDDTSRKCGGCGYRMVNPQMDFGCASYCQYAEQCLGALPQDFDFSEVREQLLKDKVAVEVKRALGSDFRRIRQTTATARFAETLGKAEGGNLAVILCSAYLRDLSPDEARTILAKVGAGAAITEEIAKVLAEAHDQALIPGREATILQDALALQQLDEQRRDHTDRGEHESPKNLHTATALDIASSLP